MGSVLARRALPFAILLLSLVAGALLVDLLLHRLDLGWVGRDLGWVGTLLILASFVYSLRKRRWIDTRRRYGKRVRRSWSIRTCPKAGGIDRC